MIERDYSLRVKITTIRCHWRQRLANEYIARHHVINTLKCEVIRLASDVPIIHKNGIYFGKAIGEKYVSIKLIITIWMYHKIIRITDGAWEKYAVFISFRRLYPFILIHYPGLTPKDNAYARLVQTDLDAWTCICVKNHISVNLHWTRIKYRAN